MSFILATRNPSNDKLVILTEENGDPTEFKTEDEAEAAAQTLKMFWAWGHMVVEIE